jgi:hypothetical protein
MLARDTQKPVSPRWTMPPSDSGACIDCKRDGELCQRDLDCCTQVCQGHTCGGVPACRSQGQTCASSSECCGGADCTAGFCGSPQCLAAGASCVTGADACCGQCYPAPNVCGQSLPGGAAPDAGPSSTQGGPWCTDDSQCPSGSVCAGWCVPVATLYSNVAISPCPGLVDHGGATTVTSIQVVPSAALPPPAPGTDAGSGCPIAGFDGGVANVTGFNVQPFADTGLQAKTLAGCDSAPDAGNPADVVVYEGVVPSHTYKLTLQAYGGGTTVIAQSLCVATPVAGILVTAMCDPLVPTF